MGFSVDANTDQYNFRNVGLGKETVEQLAKHSPQHIYLGARSAEKAEQALADIKKVLPDAQITHLPLDLSSFKSIKAAVDNSTEPTHAEFEFCCAPVE